MGYRIVLHFNPADENDSACFQAGIDAADDDGIKTEDQLREIARRSLAGHPRFSLDGRPAQIRAILDGYRWARQAMQDDIPIAIDWDRLDHWGNARGY